MGFKDRRPKFSDRKEQRGDRFGGRESGTRERFPSKFADRNGGGRGEFRRDYAVTCDTCGKECTVPFKPTNGKPVLCSNCFRKGERTTMNRSTNSSSTGSDSTTLLQEINRKLDLIIEALEIGPE